MIITYLKTSGFSAAAENHQHSATAAMGALISALAPSALTNQLLGSSPKGNSGPQGPQKHLAVAWGDSKGYCPSGHSITHSWTQLTIMVSHLLGPPANTQGPGVPH